MLYRITGHRLSVDFRLIAVQSVQTNIHLNGKHCASSRSLIRPKWPQEVQPRKYNYDQTGES